MWKINKTLFVLLILLSYLYLRTSVSLAQGPTLVQILDTLYNADGSKASGRLVISWNAFTAAGGETVDGGTKTYTIPATGTDAGKVDVSLLPNVGASPSGTSYRLRYYLSNGANYAETWVVPATGPVTIAGVRILPPLPIPQATWLTMLNGLTATTQTFSKTDDANVTLGITSSGGNHNFALGWTGQLSTARGGTNQNLWTASRCVRVNDSGTALESAASDCGTGGGGSGHTIQEESSALAQRGGLNFIGGAITASDDVANNRTNVTVSIAESDVANLVSDLAAKEAAANKNAASGYAGLDANSLLSAAQLPLPSATTLGGIKSLTCSGTDKLSAIGTDGAPVCSADQTGGGSSHNLLSATHPDTTPASPTRGDIITAQGATPSWAALAKGTQYKVLQAGANEPLWDAVHLDQSTAITGILGSANGGTGNGFAKLAGPTTSEKTWTGPDASTTLLTTNAAVTVAQGGTGAAPGADDQLLVSDSTSAATWRTLPNGALSYVTGTNTFSQAGISNLASSTSADLAGVLSDETGGSGVAVFSSSPTITTPSFTTGFKVEGAATSGQIIRGNGTNFVAADDLRAVTYIAGADNASSALADADDQPTFWRNNLGRTYRITEVWCESDAGTPSINLQRDDGTPANILSSNLSCSTSGATGSIAAAEQDVASGDKIDFVMVTAGGTAKRITVNIQLTAQ